MIIFPTGIFITETEYKSLLHVEVNPEQWLRDTLAEKARLRREALINEWRPRLFADPDVAELPTDVDALVQLIMSRADYRSRAQADAEQDPPVLPSRHNTTRFEGRAREGLAYRRTERNSNDATIILFPAGIDSPDIEVACILAYVQDLDDWILGALLGHINRGKKKMIRQYQPILMDDPTVTTIPANEDELIQVIVQRHDYKPLQ